ncbi:MAG TPA: MarR family transcriptional regulator [Ktedonobacteraceae bacterium]|nr:MarR family transcriptional regulator [Ktedonobacteraceae bacterium]
METDPYKKGGSSQELLGFALGSTARKVAKFYAKALAGHSLTPSQLFLLRQLWLEDGLPLRNLGLRTQLDAASTTWLVDQLEQAELVERRRNDTDRRIVRVWLIKAGKQIQTKLVPALTRWENVLHQELLSHHTVGEIAAFRNVLATLNNTLPEGDNLWKQFSASWDSQLDKPRFLTETTDEDRKG